MALRPFLGRFPRILLRPSNFAMKYREHQVLPISSAPACFIHSSHKFEKKKKGPIYVTMALEQEVQLFDSKGEDLGMMAKTAAEELAKSKDFHLLLISDKSKYHPVMRFCSAEEFRGQQKQEKRAKREHAKPKEKRLSIDAKIMEHDLNTKVTHVIKLLQKDCHVTVKIHNSVPGKEKQIQALFKHFTEACKEISTIKQILKKEQEMIFLLKPVEHHSSESKTPPLFTNKELKDASKK
ncbi:hypothetical protein CAPTEDRAFT_192596 [Capitella teleta]|uniref:Translation initiation factor 3 N-terminal domain-containing protein n=1 Tax=Capitella teleta TaxID=283909 RepID=R7V8U4_CAPTE|nr:hypothetical protein CAPTEDRAFT_192596 [Capitella teleta]|eukprot:ELU12771.1 hypothetical protein CAPTEDRAFT_192596 [Capitella teleta]